MAKTNQRAKVPIPAGGRNNTSIRDVPVGVCISDRYLSKWEDDVILLDTAADRHGGTARYDLTEIYLRCVGPASPLSGIRSIAEFINLRVTFKALLNHLVEKFSRSSKAKSEIARNFFAVVRFFSWAIQQRGITHCSDLNKRDFEDFITALSSAKHGIIEVTGCLPALDQLLAEIRSGAISPEQICSSDENNTQRLILRRGFISRYLGVPVKGLPLPTDFIKSLAELCRKEIKTGGRQPDTKTNLVYAYVKALNRLWELPSTVDRPGFRPYPKSHQVIVSLAGGGHNRNGRTETITPEDAIKIIEAAILWVFSYGNSIVEIVHAGRQIALDMRGDRTLEFVAEFERRATEIVRRDGLPFEVVNHQSIRRNGHDVVAINDLTAGLLTACFCLVAINHGRRLNEIVGVYGLNAGMYFGCILGKSVFPGLDLIDFYVEKTLKDWATFAANVLVVKTVRLLESLAQGFRPLDAPEICNQQDRAQARKLKLFRRLVIFSEKSWTNKPTCFLYGKHSEFFFSRLGIASSTLDSRGHPYRRIFSVLYYYRYEHPRLLALSAHLRHLFPSTTLIYVTDPAMRATADRINQLYRREQAETDDDVRSDAFVRAIVDILKGERAGGRWPQFVLAMYSKLLDIVEFADCDVSAQGAKMADTMSHDGYQRITFYFGGCNVGQSVRTASQARCADEIGKPRLERACPQLCFNCVHHDSNDVTLAALEGRAEALERNAAEASMDVAGLKEAFEKEAGMLREIVSAERGLRDETLKVLSMIRNSFPLALGA